MDNYIFLIALGLVFCSLAIVALVFLHCRKIVEKCNYYMAKGIREQDCLAKQLERTRIEKEMMEKVIKAELAEAVKSFMTGEKNDGCTTDCKRQINPEKPDVPLNKNDAFQKVQKRRVQEKR